MQTFKHPGMLLSGLILAACSLLAACGATSVGGTAGGGEATSTPGTTVVITGTQGTIHQVPFTTATPAASSAATATPGAVRLLLDKASYAPGSSAIVTIENGLGTKIVVSDHHTNCTYVQLEQLLAGAWQPMELCKSMTATRLVMLAPGSVTPQKISIPTGPAASGTYRVGLTYNNTTTYSATFTVE